MADDTSEYQTPKKRLQDLLTDVENDLGEDNPQQTWKDLAARWKDYQNHLSDSDTKSQSNSDTKSQ